jgi:hypothetical protein
MTSIEWLIEEMLSKGFFKESVTLTNIDHLQYKAEEMHKQEIIDAWNSAGGGDAYHQGKDYYQETFVSKGNGDHISDIRKMVEDDVAPIDWLINQLENHIVLSAHNKLGTNRTGDYRIGLRKAIDFCHQAKEMEAKETLYTEEQVREVIRNCFKSNSLGFLITEDDMIRTIKQPKQ